MPKKIFLTIMALVLLIAATGYFYVQHLKPTYSGELTLNGISGKVDVYFDEYGIPHIYAQSQEDAYMALGYVHAQDRLFQMEVVRRVTSGRLSEVFGKDLVKTDKFFRTLGVNEYSKKMVAQFNASGDEKTRKAANAYLSGVNQFVDNGATPIEFTILGIEKSPFTLLDINNAMGYVAFSFAAAQKIEPILTNILKGHGEEYLSALDLGSSQTSLAIPNYSNIDAQIELSHYVSDIVETLPTAVWSGSNSWVLGPGKTKSGRVILENDPHVAFSQPGVWYEAHIETPDFTFYGCHIAGVPFGVFGHSRDFATGLTMFCNDDIDLFQEKIPGFNPGQYEYKGVLRNFMTRQETIIVKDSANVDMTVRSTVHGPIINDVLENVNEPVSLFWTYTQVDVQTLEMLYGLSHVKRINDAQDVAGQIHAPGLNVMYGDSENNIAWWASAKMIQRADSANAALINDGSSGKYDHVGYYNFSENPKSINPPWGYVYSANNQTRTTSGQLYPGHYAVEDRAKRVVSLLEAKEKFDTEDVKQMALDDTSENAPEVVTTILNTVKQSEQLSVSAVDAMEVLSDWDGSFKTAKNAPVIYTKLIYKILEGAMQDELGEEVFNKLFETHMVQRSTQPLLNNDSTVWWDNIGTKNKRESRSEIFVQAINKGVEELTEQLGENMNAWKWGSVHTLEHEHAFGKIDALRSFFNVGPFKVDGSNMVLNNLKFSSYETGHYKVNAGPSTRRIVDFSDVENNSWTILPTGNSGNPFSKHYEDQAEMFVKGEYRKMMMNKEEIESTSPDLLILKPTR